MKQTGTRKRINLETERFIVRGLNPGDATPRVVNWLADEKVAEPLNQRARALSPDALAKEFGQADGVRRFNVGIWPKETPELMIGYYLIFRDPNHRMATFNVVIGDLDWWGKGVVIESRAALLSELFDNRGVEKCVGQPHTRNAPAVFNYKKQGWRMEGILRGHSLHHSGEKRLDQAHFALMKEDWDALREDKA